MRTSVAGITCSAHFIRCIFVTYIVFLVLSLINFHLL